MALPPLKEQKRIVAKVDELMALCDQLEAQQQQQTNTVLRANTSAINVLLNSDSQSTIASESNSFENNWQRIAKHFNTLYGCTLPMPPGEGRQKRYLVGLENLKGLHNCILELAIEGFLSKRGSFQILSLGDLLVEKSLNGISKKPNQSGPGTEILRISAGTSRKDSITNELDHRFVLIDKNEQLKFLLQKGDLLACRFNGNLSYVGRLSLYTGFSNCSQVFPDKLIRLRVDRKICIPEYVRYAFIAPKTRLTIEAMCATTAGNIGLSATNLKKIEICIPSLEEQTRIVKKVDQLMTLCDKLEQQLTQSYSDAEKLLEATVKALVA